MPDQRKALVTGGAGFIGSHLVERLLSDGHTVVVLDDLSCGRTRNLAHLADNPRLTFQKGSILDGGLVTSLAEGVSWVFHMAALADIVPSIQNPTKYHAANVDGTVCVLEAARRAGVERFVYAASSSCYGLPDTTPTPEDSPVRPMYPYALTKWVGEQYVLHWQKTYKLPAVSLRLFNVYGPRARTTGSYGAVFGVFLRQKLGGKPFTVVGDGAQTRDFTYVTDVVDAFVKAAESSVVGEVFNVGSGNTYSVNRLVELLGGPVTYIPKRPGEPDCTFADTRKIASGLHWKPKVRFEEGVRIMLSQIEDWRDAPLWDETSIADATKDWFRYLGAPAASA
ncbi:MAG: SDR family oxidoreductase [Chloroflexi bacterium]|nr:SDR family oxidoreductase [Chloroflexota bacterium]